MSWAGARALLAGSVVRHLGEDLALSEAPPGSRVASVRGVLTSPEQVQRLGLAHIRAGDARLTLRVLDAPEWLSRGVFVDAQDAPYRITEIADNGEGVLEIILCRQ